MFGKLNPADNCSTSEHATNNHKPVEGTPEVKTNEQYSSTICSQNQPCILQLDGNDSVLTEEDLNTSRDSLSSSSSSQSSSSSVPQTNDQYSCLPTIYSANARSIFAKYIDLLQRLQNHRLDLVQISETWQDVNKKDHNDKIDTLKNNFGYTWFSYARPKYKDDGSLTGGGGSAILVNSRKWLAQRLDDIIVPQGLEIIWIKVIPRFQSIVKILITCGLYSKPNSRKKSILSDHIASTYHLLKMKHKEARFVFMGDFNCYKPDDILLLSPRLRQLVHYPTHKDKTLDLIITDLHTLYHPPVSVPPLLPDHPAVAAPSDHLGNLLIPRNVPGVKTARICRTITVRPISESQMSAIGRWIATQTWTHLEAISDVDNQLDTFTNEVFCILDAVAPKKSVKVALDDPPWMNTRIKTVIRQRNREFDKNSKSEKWKKLLNKSKKMIKKAKQNFSLNFISGLKDTDPATWMKRMDRLGKASFETGQDGWKFQSENLSDQDLTEDIADYFANISNSFTPVDPSLLDLVPPGADFVSETSCIPTEPEVFSILQTSKKTSSVPNDLPTTFLKEFLPFLSKPALIIFSNAILSGKYPTRWKTEFVSPHPKVLPPVSYGDLRNLSLTEFFNKTFERFILKGTSSVKGLLHYITRYYDPAQYAVPGASCSHALLSIINFILKQTDNPNKPTAVINLMADWSKAFNKVNHNIIMRILIALKVPQWLLRLILSYLQNRKMILRFRNCCSSPKCLPGGCPQGTLIGVILYILYINPIGFPGDITINLSDTIHNYWEKMPPVPHLSPSALALPETLNCTKFMDDATLQESIDLLTTLATKLDRAGPLPFWESSGKLLPNNNTLLQTEIESLKKISDSREMVLNPDKTKLMIINFSTAHQFQSLLRIPDSSSKIELCFETKLLGYWLTSDIKPDKHVSYILKIAYGRLWAITRLKAANVTPDDIFHFYSMKIRSVLEFAAPVFFSMLTSQNIHDIERVQKVVLKIILAENYHSYEDACVSMSTVSLEKRRQQLALKFALSCLKNQQHKHLFKQRTSTYYTLRNIKSFEVPQCHTSRYFSSPIPAMTRLLNTHFGNENTSNYS